MKTTKFTKKNAKEKGHLGGLKSWASRTKGKSKKEIREMMSKIGKIRWKNKGNG